MAAIDVFLTVVVRDKAYENAALTRVQVMHRDDSNLNRLGTLLEWGSYNIALEFPVGTQED